MTRLDLDPDLQRLGDALRASATIDLAREEHTHADRSKAGRAPVLRRPKVFAGGTLGLAGVGVALVVALSAGGATAPPAFAITQKADGTVLVKFDHPGQVKPGYNGTYLSAVDQNLRATYHETILVTTAPGPATVKGPVDCVPVTGLDAGAKTPVKVLFGDDGTAVIPAGNTGAGTVHLTGCSLFNDAGSSNTGNTGN